MENLDLSGYARSFFNLAFSVDRKGKIPRDKPVFGFAGEPTDEECCQELIEKKLVESNGIDLTENGFNVLCRLKS